MAFDYLSYLSKISDFVYSYRVSIIISIIAGLCAAMTVQTYAVSRIDGRIDRLFWLNQTAAPLLSKYGATAMRGNGGTGVVLVFQKLRDDNAPEIVPCPVWAGPNNICLSLP